jgi:hypothetical protein
VAKRIEATEQYTACEVCGRTMLRGERAEPYLLPSRERRLVCELCAPRAQQEGWIREAAAPDTPAQPPRPSDRRRFFKRRRRRPGALAAEEPAVESASIERGFAQPSERFSRAEAPDEPIATQEKATAPRDPRHVRAIPTNAELKIERALDLFNGSEHPRTVAGISRSLGSPRVSAATSESSTAEVVLTIAWDLSWYQFCVDLSDTKEPVRVRGRGDELDELPPEVRRWNAQAQPDGSVSLDTAPSLNGEHADSAI